MMRNPSRLVEVPGPLDATGLLGRLGVNRESVLVIVDGTLVTGDTPIPDEAHVQLRPVISGGAG